MARCALAAAGSTENACFASKRQRPERHRGHKRATVAVARKTLVCTCHMLANGEHLDPSDFERVTKPRARAKPEGEPDREALTEESALRIPGGLGYDIAKAVAP